MDMRDGDDTMDKRQQREQLTTNEGCLSSKIDSDNYQGDVGTNEGVSESGKADDAVDEVVNTGQEAEEGESGSISAEVA